MLTEKEKDIIKKINTKLEDIINLLLEIFYTFKEVDSEDYRELKSYVTVKQKIIEVTDSIFYIFRYIFLLKYSKFDNPLLMERKKIKSDYNFEEEFNKIL